MKKSLQIDDFWKKYLDAVLKRSVPKDELSGQERAGFLSSGKIGRLPPIIVRPLAGQHALLT